MEDKRRKWRERKKILPALVIFTTQAFDFRVIKAFCTFFVVASFFFEDCYLPAVYVYSVSAKT